MSIEFPCESCGRLLRGGEGTAGRRTLCPGCGAFSTVPVPEVGPEEAPIVPDIVPDIVPEATLPPPPPPGGELGSPFGFGGPEPADWVDPNSPSMQYGGPAAPTDSKAVASLVLGISGFVFFLCCPPAGIPIGIVGLALGMKSIKSNSPGRGLALAGTILCGIQIALAVLYLVVFAFFFAGMGMFDGAWMRMGP